MLLFADGFETFNIYDIGRKWGGFEWDHGSDVGGPGPLPAIVHGADLTFSPAKLYARTIDGRALQGKWFKLATPIRPSRTVFTGFAHRIAAKPYSVNSYVVEIQFLKAFPYDKATYGVYTTPTAYRTRGTVVATCKLRIYPSYIDVTWTFIGTTPQTQTGRINTSSVLDNGDFRYFQVGMTLTGNVVAQPQAWAEVRLGSRGGANNLAHSNIMTAPETGGNASFLVDAVSIRVASVSATYGEIESVAYATHGLDDVDICNDEGEFNNTFLGSTRVKRVSVSGDGTENNSVPYAETYRFRTVDEDFIDTVQNLPVPLPNHETTPLFIEWETFANNYLTLEESGDRQLLRFTSLGLNETYQKIHGAVLHALMQPLHLDTPATITAVRKIGTEAPITSRAMDAPLIKRTEFEARQFVWENEETIGDNQSYIQWAAAQVDASEWGFVLAPVEIAPELYDPAIARNSLIIYDTVVEALAFAEVVLRFLEELVADSFEAGDDPTYEYVYFVAETFGIASLTEGNRAGNRFLNETIEFEDVIPWTYMFAGEFVGFEEAVSIQFLDAIHEALDVYDWTDGFWEEVFLDAIELTEETAVSIIETLDETFGLEEPYLWDGHELIEDEFAIDADEPWDNHELAEEYLYPDDEVAQGVGLKVEDAIGIAEDHHDGWWVDLPTDYTMIADSVLTQHWRYETMFGMVVNSWQEAPIEQPGNDGNHTGDNPWGA